MRGAPLPTRVIGRIVRGGCGALGTVAVLAIAGCATSGKSNLPVPMVPGPGSAQIQELNRADYNVVAPATGSSTVSYVGLWPIPIALIYRDGRMEYFGFETPFMPHLFLVATNEFFIREPAVTSAVKSVPNADALISPNFDVTSRKIFFWYARTTVTASGKAIQIKTDSK